MKVFKLDFFSASCWQQTLIRTWLSRGPLAYLLLPLSLVFAVLTRIRACFYRWSWRPVYRVNVPVIVVGNLIAGGAGKTPTVLALALLLKAWGWNVGIISRGHGGRVKSPQEVLPESPARDVGDEPLLLRRRAQVPVMVGRQRVFAAQQLLALHPEINLIISDDGLQHTALHRDIQILVFDDRGCGNGWLLPAGPLREPFRREPPPRTLVVYNSPQPSTSWPGHLGSRYLAGALPWSQWKSGATPSVQALQILAQRSQQETLWAVAGIAQPSRFFHLLEDSGIRFFGLPLADHYNFAHGPMWPMGSVVLMTEKDAVKLTDDIIQQSEVWVVPLNFQFDAQFEAALLFLLNKLSLHSPFRPLSAHGTSIA
ncbi:MAG: tetraacyldisaccharide 4'-kinase [Burkholderiales bacterium]